MNNVIVVDTSIAIKWVIEEPDSAKALALLTDWSRAGKKLLAPALLTYEITNAIYQRVRKRELTAERAREALAYVLFPELELDFSEFESLSKQAMELAIQYNLPAAYDPHYLALALREDCEYWTADNRLLAAIRGKFPWVHALDEIP